MYKSLVALSGVDLVLFLVAGTIRILKLHLSSPAVGSLVTGVYWLAAIVGLLLCIFAFIVLSRGKEGELRSSSLCVLLAFIPGCAALIGVLSSISHHPV